MRCYLFSLVSVSVISMFTVGASAQTLDEFDWANLNPAGSEAWENAANWNAPANPPGNPDYPDDPLHEDMDPAVIDPVVGANFSVALNNALDVSIAADVTIASLVLGAVGQDTNISGPGRILLRHDEDNFVEQIPDPNDPGSMVDQVTCSFNCGVARVTSNLGGSNTISAIVGSTERIDFVGAATLTLSGGFEEVAIDAMDNTVANNTVIRSHLGTYLLGTVIENQPRLLVTGPVTTVVDQLLDAANEPFDVPLWINGGDTGIPQFPSPANTEPGTGYQHGIIDLVGGITGPGDVAIGTVKRDLETLPLPTTVLYDNSYSGGTLVNRGNVILRSDNAFGTGDVRNGNPANAVGYNLIVEPGPGETAGTVDRTLTNDIEIPHDWTVKGEHSLTLTGDNFASNSAGWVNLLSDGEELLLEGRQFAETGNIFTYDGTGLTRVRGQLRNHPDDIIDTGVDPNGARPGGQIRKRGTGAVYVESSLAGLTNTLRLGNIEVDINKDATVIVEGGNLSFATVGDMGDASGRVESRGGAIGLADGTVTGPGTATLMNKMSNFANRDVPLEGDVESFRDFDNGGLMLAPSESNASLDFTAALANAQDMSVAAPATGMVFTGTITPANSTYRLGGGSGTLTVSGNNKLTGGNSLVVTNGGDFRNPNGEDRVMLGMVRLDGTNDYAGGTTIIGKYQRTLQDQASRDSVSLGEVNARGGPEEQQYNGTTLAVTSLVDGNSSIGASTGAADLVIQGSTLRYEGGAVNTNRLFTVGTAGATLDASGSGAVNFTNTSALDMDVAESRGGNYLAFEGESLFRVTNVSHTDDLLIGMPVSGGEIPAGSVISEIKSPTRFLISNAFDVFDLGSGVPLTFGAVDRVVALTGSNTMNNTLSPLVADAPDGGGVGIEKSGVGRWVLTANNTYSGATTIDAGTLLINGNQSGGGAYTVAASGTLGGTGSVMGDVAVAGTLSPGTDGIGTFGVTGNVIFNDDAIFAVDIDANSMASDTLAVAGDLDLSGINELVLTLAGGSLPANGPFVIATYSGSLTGTFDSLNGTYTVDYGTGLNSQITISNITNLGSVTGDFNNDGLWNCADVNQLTAAIASSSADLAFDMNGDGQITLADLTDAGNGWLAVAGAATPGTTSGNPYLPGDANLDGVVDGQDFIIWNDNKFTNNDAFCSADMNADGAVDGQDFITWNDNKFTSSDAVAVPEPCSLVWLVLSAAFCVGLRRSGRSE